MKNLIQRLFAPLAVPQNLTGNYYPALDGLRGLAILLVLLPHFGINHYLHPYGLFMDSTTGVHLFFVISGFIITTLLLKERIRNGKVSLKYFYIRRVLRILPVAWLFLLVLWILNRAFGLHIRPFDFIGAALFFNNLPISSSYYTAHFWTLAVEIQFYLIFPLIVALSVDYYLIISLLIIIIVPVVAIAGNYCPATFGQLLFVKLCMYAFWKGPVMILVGAVFAVFLFKSASQPKWLQNYYAGLLLLIAALIIRSETFIFYQKYISEYLFALLASFAILNILNGESLLSKILNSKILVRIGVLSYSLYIWQQLFVGPNAWQPWMSSLRNSPLWPLMMIKIVVVSLTALASYAFEKQFLKLKDKFKYGWTPGKI